MLRTENAIVRVPHATQIDLSVSLHGLAVAVFNGEDGCKVSGTAIALDGRDSQFRKLEELRIKSKIYLEDPNSIYELINVLIDRLETLVAAQECNCAKISYLPVVLMIGEDGRNPVGRAVVDAIQAVIKAGLEPEIADKLTYLLGRCALRIGSYSGSLSFGQAGKNEPIGEPSDKDCRLLKLRDGLNNGDEACLNELVKQAYNDGMMMGIQNFDGIVFQVSGPSGYRENTCLHETHPALGSYLDWGDGILRESFHEGFELASRMVSKFRRRFWVKLPTDPPQPHFTDPCANMIRLLFDTLAGEMDRDHIPFDNSELLMVIDSLRSPYRPNMSNRDL